MLANVGLYSYLAAALTYVLLTGLLLVSWRGRALGIMLIMASGASALWASVVAAGTVLEYPPVVLIQVTEILRNTGWLLFLLKLSQLRFADQEGFDSALWNRRLLLGLGFASLVILLLPALPATLQQ